MEYLLRNFYSAGFFCLLFIAASCSPGLYLFEPQIDTPLKVFENNNNIIFKVYDERKTNPYSIPGYDNRNIEYTIPIAEYIETYFNNSLKQNSVNSAPEVVSVIIDQLRYDDLASIKYSFRFSEPISVDTNFVFRISSKYFNENVKVVNHNNYLNYALTDCLESFFSYDNEITGIYVTTSTNQIDTQEKILVDSGIVDIETVNNLEIETTGGNQSSITEVKLGNTFFEKIILRSIGFSYFTGDKITGGFHLYYSTGKFNELGSNIFGYGFGIMYYDILNLRDGFDGFIFSFTAPLHFTYYLSGYEDGLYIGSTLKIMIGNESIDYGFDKKEHFFIGPTIEPYLGIKVSNAISFDIGGYWLALLGSKMLPDDFGARFNLNIWF